MKLNQQVRHAKQSAFSGHVRAQHTIVVCGRQETVYVVEWDGNPATVPMQWHDENGSDVRGYLASELTEI